MFFFIFMLHLQSFLICIYSLKTKYLKVVQKHQLQFVVSVHAEKEPIQFCVYKKLLSHEYSLEGKQDKGAFQYTHSKEVMESAFTSGKASGFVCAPFFFLYQTPLHVQVRKCKLVQNHCKVQQRGDAQSDMNVYTVYGLLINLEF